MRSKQIIEPEFLVVDLFCGAGGTTTGFEMTNGIAKVIACVNHDANAIKSHWANHPDVVHFEEDIRTLKLGGLFELVKKYRKQSELIKADAEFCKERWDMNRPEYERKLYRDQSNEVTFARQELQRALQFFNKI